jgi:ABC-2 type transport system ATP-binding protein
MIEKVGLEVEQNKKIGQLSKGYRQRVGLAQAIIHDPEVLILDEPTSGLDPNQLLEIRSLIKSIGKEKTVMLSTHIMQEVEAICDRIVIINKGEIVADNTAKDLQSEGGNLTVYAEFEGEVTKSMLKKIEGVGKIERVTNGWLLESKDNVDLRKRVAKFAQENDFLAITLRVEEKSLEEVFKNLTNR